MKALIDAWQQRWETWTQRERRMVVAMLGAVGLALVYLLLLDPALSGRAKLQRDLPKLRADAAEMSGIAAGAAEDNHLSGGGVEQVQAAARGPDPQPSTPVLGHRGHAGVAETTTGRSFGADAGKAPGGQGMANATAEGPRPQTAVA